MIISTDFRNHVCRFKYQSDPHSTGKNEYRCSVCGCIYAGVLSSEIIKFKGTGE